MAAWADTDRRTEGSPSSASCCAISSRQLAAVCQSSRKIAAAALHAASSQNTKVGSGRRPRRSDSRRSTSSNASSPNLIRRTRDMACLRWRRYAFWRIRFSSASAVRRYVWPRSRRTIRSWRQFPHFPRLLGMLASGEPHPGQTPSAAATTPLITVGSLILFSGSSSRDAVRFSRRDSRTPWSTVAVNQSKRCAVAQHRYDLIGSYPDHVSNDSEI